MVLRMDGHAGRLVAGVERPLLAGDHLLRINSHHGALVFQVDVYVACAVRRGELRAPAQLNGTVDTASPPVDHCRIGGAPVESEYALGCGVVDDCVRIPPGGSFTGSLHGLQVEDLDLVGAASADEAAIQVRGHRDAVHPRRVRNAAEPGSTIEIEHFNLRTM